MTGKRILAALLALCMVLSLAACGGESGGSSQQSGTTESQSSQSSQSSQGGESSESSGEVSQTAGEDLKEPELVTLNLITMASGKEETGVAHVEEAMNQLLEDKFNVNVKLTFYPFGSYAEQTTLALSAGVDVDLIAVYMIPYALPVLPAARLCPWTT